MKRHSTNKAKDARIFRDTATKMKVRNLPSTALRGGIRLWTNNTTQLKTT